MSEKLDGIQEVEETVTAEEVAQEETTETYTKEEVDKMLQSEADKRVTKALQTAQEKWEQEYATKLEAEKSEAEKLAKMSEGERFKVELAKEREAFEAERQAFQRMQLEAQAVKELSNEGLSTDLAQFVMADNAETIQQNIATFKGLFQQAIEQAVDERLKGRTPSTGTSSSSVNAKELAKMSYSERLQALKENPNLLK